MIPVNTQLKRIIILGKNSSWFLFRVVYFSYLFTIKTQLYLYFLENYVNIYSTQYNNFYQLNAEYTPSSLLVLRIWNKQHFFARLAALLYHCTCPPEKPNKWNETWYMMDKSYWPLIHISKTKKDIPKRKTLFFFTLKSL